MIGITVWNITTSELLFCSAWIDDQPQEHQLGSGNTQGRDEKGNLK